MSQQFDVPVVRTHSVERQRLASRLGSGDSRPALAVVHGFAGSGKTTLLTQWSVAFAEGDDALVWMTLRAEDSGPTPFWNRLGDTLARAGHLDHSDAASLGQPGSSGDNTRRAILERAGRTHPLTLVLDDYHLVQQEELDRQIQFALLNVSTLRLVVGTRTTGPWHSLILAARLKTVFIDASELTFTRDESAQLVEANTLANSPGLAQAIHNATLGWPLASQALLAEVIRDPERLDSLGRVAQAHPQFVSEFVRGAIEGRDPAAADFLLRVSFADEISIELAAQLSGESPTRSEAHITELEAEGIGTWQVRSGTTWFRMHPLLREGFEAHASVALGRTVTDRIRGVLSDRLRNARPLRSLELAFQISDWSRVEQISLLRYGPLTHYHREANTRLLQTIPQAALRERPALMATLHGTIYGLPAVTTDDLTRSIAAVASAAKAHPVQEESVLGALQATAIMAAHRIMGESKTALLSADRALALLLRSSAQDRAVNARSLPTLFAQVATTLLVEGEFDKAIDVLSRWREVPAEAMSTGELFQNAALTALTHATRGDITEAKRWIATCEQVGAYDGWFVGYIDSGYHIAKAIIALNQWDTDGALDAIATPGTREHVIEFWPYLALIEARASLWKSGPMEAHAGLVATLSRKKWRPQPPAALLSLVTAVAAELLVLGGQPVRAANELAQALAHGFPATKLAQARLASLRGETELALTLADSVAWNSHDIPRLRVEALLAAASSCWDLGDFDRATDTFVAAVRSIERYEIRLALLSIAPSRLSDLWMLARDRGHEIDSDLVTQTPKIMSRIRTVEPLSGAEQRVLRALLSADIADVAQTLHLSVHTVRYHLKRSYKKLGVSTRDEAVRLAHELGMLEE